MCGIVGIAGLNPLEPVDETRLKIMRDVLRHRGPDGEGLWTEGSVGLGFRRLAIIDVEGGAQPMPNEDGSVWLVFNGEIYNHAKLRPWLEARGHRYRTRSDTETIVHLYEEEGERCVEKLQGMFAFAVWDRARQRLLLARDRLGIKPLYYALTDHELVFASEIKAILASGAVTPTLNRAIVPEFLANRYIAGTETFFRGVRKLLPGRTLTWSAREGVRERRYWRLPDEVDDAATTPAEAAGRVRAGLEAAVRSHLMSDVPLGLFLSGGLDSSALAGLMSRMVKGPIRTFSVGLPDADANELDYARLAARAAGSVHREVVVSPSEFFDALPVRQFEKTARGWAERMVGLEDDGETLRFALAPGVTPYASLLADAPAGGQAEISEAGRAIAATIGARLRQDGGWALIVDYGYARGTHGASLQAVRGHRGASILERPGETDLSAHVDFSALAEATGMPTFGPVGQGEFLQRLGIMQRAETLKARAGEAERRAIDAALARLIGPDQMGTLFRVLAVGDSRSAAPAGFPDRPSDAT